MFHAFCFLLLLPLSFAIHPAVLFPGYALSKFEVTVADGNIAGCPTDGSFDVEYGFTPSGGFDNECIAKYLALNYTNNKFYNMPSVTINIPGRTTGGLDCINGLYNNMIEALVNAGLEAGETLRSACYDWRAAPNSDVVGLDNPGFMANTQKVIELAYNSSGGQKVWLIAHSNGPIMASYFMKTIGSSFIKKYVGGYITLSANVAGQALGTVVPALGFTPKDFSFDPVWTPTHGTWPANAMTAAQPNYFTLSEQRNVTFLMTDERSYSTNADDVDALYEEIGADFMRNNWRKFIGLITPKDAPPVYTYAFFGADLDTAVGIIVDSLPITTWANDPDAYLFLQGDANQEAIDNEAVLNWGLLMPDGCFEHMELPGVNHFDENSNTAVLDQIVSLVSGNLTEQVCTSGSLRTVAGILSGILILVNLLFL